MKFTVFQGADGAWYWHAKTRNGRIVAIGGEGYVRKGGAWRAAVKFADRMQTGLVVMVAP